ncbi:hypothetical protein Tco_0272769 [Tanacetum coccineum]
MAAEPRLLEAAGMAMMAVGDGVRCGGVDGGCGVAAAGDDEPTVQRGQDGDDGGAVMVVVVRYGGDDGGGVGCGNGGGGKWPEFLAGISPEIMEAPEVVGEERGRC